MKRTFLTILGAISVALFLCSICNRGTSAQTSSYQGDQSDSEFVSVDITYEEQLGR